MASQAASRQHLASCRAPRVGRWACLTLRVDCPPDLSQFLVRPVAERGKEGPFCANGGDEFAKKQDAVGRRAVAQEDEGPLAKDMS